ncbi:putative membrane protein [Melghirimyces profundicolus]|uniref:Putative membrane protein n=1 Tax=Melghirimyces profundicolus TaxID=1242148 RepID=A0A2T6BQ96_9BACL|nr:DUF502 domain-containing protein [Melghirimyces profundicolus]PTX58273.1 putative membrane protein [Melghirimyces profundicolus]
MGRRILKRLTLYFFNGLLVILPLAGTLYLLQYFYRLVNDWGVGWLPERSSGLPWLSDLMELPGAGILLILAVVTLTGMFARWFAVKKLIDGMEAVISRIPLVKGVYGTLKDTMHSFFGDKTSFDTVVFVTVADSKRIGFLTVKEPRFRTADGKEYVGVYFPQSMQFAGDLHWFEADRVEVLDLSVDEALRIVLSAGIAGK